MLGLSLAGAALVAYAALALDAAPAAKDPAPASAEAAATPVPAPVAGPELAVEEPVSSPAPVESVAVPAEPPPARPPARPRMAASVGMGATLDSTGFDPQRTGAGPAFIAIGDIGEDTLGFEVASFASQTSGRYRAPDNPIDRLSLDAMVVLRPLVAKHRVPTSYRARAARTLGFELGLGLERVGRGTQGGSRFGVHTGAHIELPLTAADALSDLRLRLGVRRLIGLYTPRLGTTDVTDATDLYAALVVWF